MSLGDNSKKAFSNWRHNSVVLNFPNGNSISTIWGIGTYSDNNRSFADHEKFSELLGTFMESDTVEVMVDCGVELHCRLHRKFDGDGSVIGHLTITDWLYILNALAREKKEPNGQQ